MRIKVVRADNSESIFEITPAVEYAFELTHKKSWEKAFLEENMRSHVYWVIWECVRRSGETVKPFGMDFVETIKSWDFIFDDPNG